MATIDTHEDYDWKIGYTLDGKHWEFHYSDDFEVLRELARSLVSEHEGNPKFRIFAGRVMVLSTSDFLDETINPGCIRPGFNPNIANNLDRLARGF